jgi:hypothetical protein
MEVKSSFVRTTSAASLATSLPRRPIATPMSADFNAGASLTPSPVTATTWPPARRAVTIASLCAGEVRANRTPGSEAMSRRAAGASRSTSSPVTTLVVGSPICFAMARAVNP